MDQTVNQAITLDEFYDAVSKIQIELEKIMVGQKSLIHDLIVTLLAGGNALLEGVPGLGKTILVRTLSYTVDCSFNRIQFTPDLMPADITGTLIITELSDGQRGFRFEKGPIFANIVLADEINRAAPRTQSALLESMQEKQVTVSGQTYSLPAPFFVLATQNPIEMEGTYPLPEAQLDRFLYKIEIPYPEEMELVEIARRTTSSTNSSVEKVVDGNILSMMQQLVRQVPVEDRVYEYAARLVSATHPSSKRATDSVRRHLRVGASPRGIQSMIMSAKVESLLDRRKAVSIDDIRKVVFPALRHRLILVFKAQAEGVAADSVIADILKSVPVP